MLQCVRWLRDVGKIRVRNCYLPSSVSEEPGFSGVPGEMDFSGRFGSGAMSCCFSLPVLSVVLVSPLLTVFPDSALPSALLLEVLCLWNVDLFLFITVAALFDEVGFFCPWYWHIKLSLYIMRTLRITWHTLRLTKQYRLQRMHGKK